MKDFKLTRNEQPARCHVCGIKSKDVFSLAEDGQKERMLCSVCLSLEHPEKMKLETQTGLLLKRNTNRKLYSLLFRSIERRKSQRTILTVKRRRNLNRYCSAQLT
ncbi:TPA: hypothetical protein ACGR8R_004380 [Enterobacter hormaechei]